MTATDLTALLDGDLNDSTNRRVLSDALLDIGDEDAADLLRNLSDGLAAVSTARDLLRTAGLVEPRCLRIHANGEWSWCLYFAREGHPQPGNAGRGHTHPAPEMIRDGGAMARTRGQSVWLARMFARVARDWRVSRRADCPGSWAVMDACQQLLGLPKHMGAVAGMGGELLTLDLEAS